MSIPPLAWSKLVKESYGSLAEFSDKSTVLIVRADIASQRADNQVILDAAASHPGAVDDTMVSEVTTQSDELAALDDELETWLKNREAVKA